MRHAARLLVSLAPLLLTGCSLFSRPSAQAGPQPHYVVGSAYKAGAAWFYPQEDFNLDTTGLAVVLPDRTGLTADGEAWDSMAMAGAHPTLQLPAVALVTNLQNGLQASIRVNDRGPASPGRLIGLTRHAADRLGMTPDAATRVRVQVEDGPSRALRDFLRGSPSLKIERAPREGVASEELAPPPGLQRSDRGRIALVSRAATASDMPGAVAPASLPDTVSQVSAHPGELWLRAGEFGEARYAHQVQARLVRLGGTVERVRQGRFDTYQVRAGPFADVSQADLALDQALGAGVTDAHIVVE